MKEIFPFLILALVIFTAYLLKKLFIPLLLRTFVRPKFQMIKIILESLEKYFLLWIFFLGLIIALDFSSLSFKILFYLNKIILILFTISIALFSANILIKLANFYILQKTEILVKVSLFEILIKVVIYSIAFIIILSVLGINIAPFLTTLGVAGLAVGLALKDTLGNFFAGLNILMARQIKPGDFIRLESGEEGFVEDINWRTTTIRLLPNNLVIIPNAKLAESIILNYNLPTEDLAVLIQVGISYESDLEKVERITLEVAKELMQSHPEGVPDFEPFLRFQNFGDFSINFVVILRAKNVIGRNLLVHDFIKRLHDRYKKEGIEIPFPIRKVYLTQEKN